MNLGCPFCQGKGYTVQWSPKGISVSVMCYECEGTGKVSDGALSVDEVRKRG